MHRWRETYGAAFSPSGIELPLDRILDAVLHDILHATMTTRTEQLIGAYLPELPADQVTRIAAMSFVQFKAGLDLVMSHEGDEREAYIKDVEDCDVPLPGTTGLREAHRGGDTGA